jgi:hypothetical protein
MKATYCFTIALCVVSIASAQTVYVPSGTGGIGTSGNANVGIGTSAPVDQLEVVSGNRRIGFNTPISGITPGSTLTLSRPVDGVKTLFLGATAEGSNRDNVIFSQSGNSEMRLISGGTASQGFGFYLNTPLLDAFSSIRPSSGPAMKLDGSGNLGIGIIAPTSRLQVVGVGNTFVDFKVNGRILTGDAANNGGVYFNTGQNLFIGQTAANVLGFSNGTTRMVVTNTGAVGIGTISPTTRLDISGSGGSNVDLKVNGCIKTGDATNQGGVWLNGSQTMFIGNFNSDKLGLFSNGAYRLAIDNIGNVGIGTEFPDAKLAVKGKIHTQELKVDLNGAVAPDYVFDKDYELLSLKEVKSYIDANHHLPEVPSAKEFEASGVNVGEMNLLLLKKIEELTLYVINLQSQTDLQRKEIEKLKSSQK